MIDAPDHVGEQAGPHDIAGQVLRVGNRIVDRVDIKTPDRKAEGYEPLDKAAGDI